MKAKVLGLISLMLLSTTAWAEHRHLGTDAAIGGGLGGAVGGLLGAEVGGRDGAILGAGVGAILGTAYNTRDYQYRPRGYYRVSDHHHYERHHYYEPRRYHHDRHHRYGYRGGFCPPGHAKKGWCR